MKTWITYNAIFSYDTDGITVTFPDLPECITCGFSREEAIRMATEALELCLESYNSNNMPTPSSFETISLSDNQEIVPKSIQRK